MRDGRTVIASIMNSSDRYGDAQKLMTYAFSVLKDAEPAENVYIVRHAPAGQTLSDIQEKQQQAAELAAQQEQNPGAEKAQKTSGQSQDSKDYVPFSPAA